jgi:hypothetical protein
MTKDEINAKLQLLRVQWKTADLSMRRIIEARARMLKRVLKNMEYKNGHLF